MTTDASQSKRAATVGKVGPSMFSANELTLRLPLKMGCIEVDVGSLIELVQIYPHLYDIKDKNYKSNSMKENSWEEISAALSISIDDCKRLWKNLRDRFTKERRSLIMGPEGPTSDWPYYKKMQFYSQYCTPRKTIAPARRRADRENYMIHRPIAPKQIPEDTDSLCSAINFPESDLAVSENEENLVVRKNYKLYGPERKEESSLNLKRKLNSDEADDIKMVVTTPASNVNDTFALYLANRLNEMPPEVARAKRKLIISIIEDLRY